MPFSEGSKCVLSNGTIKFSHYSEFNDPFDCKIQYNVTKSMDYIKSRPDIFKGAGRLLQLSPAKLIQKKQQMLIGIKKTLESGEYHDDVISRVGICCLTTKPDNILMWSHYADNHKGFVVEFSTNHTDKNMCMDTVEDQLFGWDVDYKQDMPTIIAGTKDFDSVKDVFLTKSPDWEYESEYRVLAMRKGPGIHNFDQSMITRVIAGTKIRQEDYQELEILVNNLSDRLNKKVELVKASMVVGQYKLDTA